MYAIRSYYVRVAESAIDDVLTYALFPQVGLKFLQNRDNPDAFEPPPDAAAAAATAAAPTGGLMSLARILVVDDEESIREFLTILLEKEDYEVA